MRYKNRIVNNKFGEKEKKKEIKNLMNKESSNTKQNKLFKNQYVRKKTPTS